MSDKPASVIVEVGPHLGPVVDRINRDILPRDKSDKVFMLERDKAFVGNLERRGLRTIQGDVSKLPFAPDSVDAFVIKDVIGHKGQVRITGPQQYDIIDTGSVGDISANLARATRPGGSVIIVETITPFDKGKVVESFTSRGFEVVKSFGQENIGDVFSGENFRRGVSERASSGSYALVFRKKE